MPTKAPSFATILVAVFIVATAASSLSSVILSGDPLAGNFFLRSIHFAVRYGWAAGLVVAALFGFIYRKKI